MLGQTAGTQKIEELPKLQAEDIMQASRSFKAQTSVIDGWHPRHLASMSKGCRTALAEVFNQAEEVGDFPEAQASLIVRLLPKLTGGVRP